MVTKPALFETLASLKVSQTEVIPFGIWDSNTIRTSACKVGRRLNRSYSVRVDRKAARYLLTRNS